MFSISTAYMSPDGKTGRQIVKEALNLGFGSIEINVEITSEQLKEITESADKGEIAVSSVHNFSPRLEDIPEGQSIYGGFLFSSDDPKDREKAVTLTCRSIDIAVRLNASAVILHAGTSVTELSGREFFSYVRKFGKAMLYDKYLKKIKSDRAKIIGKSLKNVTECLMKINEYAVKKNIMLGLENRYYFEEIPLIDEAESLIDRLGGNLGYWHDVGHAELFIRTGLVENLEVYLKRYKEKLIGIHLHDVKKFQDHLAPGCGEVDFRPFTSFLNSKTLKVIEAHRYSTPEELMASQNYLRSFGII